MTTPHHHQAPETGDKAHPAAKPNDSAETGQKLLADLGTKFYGSSSTPDNIKQLVTDGILPAGSSVIDMGTVKDHLTADTAKQAELKGQNPADTTAATTALTDAKGVQTAAGTAYDKAATAAKPLEDKIAARDAQDATVQKDFNTLKTATKQDAFSKDDLTKLAGDASKPQAVRDAAKEMLGTFQDHTFKTGRGGTGHSETDDYTSGAGFMWATQKFSQSSIDSAKATHHTQDVADQKSLAPLETVKAQALAAKNSADTDVSTKQTALDTINQANTALATQKTDVDRRVVEEQQALKPDGSLDKAARVVKGGGYYQVAENLLGISDKGGHTTAQEKELKMLTHLLQEQAKEGNGGKLPPYLKQNDPLLQADSLAAVMAKLKKSLAPPEPAPAAAPPPTAPA